MFAELCFFLLKDSAKKKSSMIMSIDKTVTIINSKIKALLQ